MLDETKKLYQDAKENIMIMTRAMEYFDDVTEELKWELWLKGFPLRS